MRQMTDKQLENLLQQLPKQQVKDNFSSSVMEQIISREQGELRLLRNMVYGTWVILAFVIGGLWVWSYNELTLSGFFEFVALLRENFSSEYVGEIFQVLITVLPYTPLLLSLFFLGIWFFSIVIYKKLPQLVKKSVSYA